MRPIWTGSISFGLINIPVALFAAAARDELKFRLLRASDLSPVNYKRIAEADGRDVPWDQIVKGYEYEKGNSSCSRMRTLNGLTSRPRRQSISLTSSNWRRSTPCFFTSPTT